VTTPTPQEETWWEVLTTTGLRLTLPAPSTHTPLSALTAEAFVTEMNGGSMYAFKTEDILYIRQYQKVPLDPERLDRAKLRASKTGSPLSKDGSQDRDSQSAATPSPSGRSTGATTKRPTLH
jgi:hypothetical protein